MSFARIIKSARSLIGVLVLVGLAGQATLLAQEKSPASAAAPAGGVPANLFTAEPPFPTVLYTKEQPPPTPKLEDLALQTSVYRYGVTWTFDKPARVGRFVTGDWYVVGPATITAISPKPLYGDEVKDPELPREAKYAGKYCRNGSVLNLPVESFPTGFDSRVLHNRYKPELSAHLPISMKPGDSLISSISLPKAGDYCMRSYSVLTCLKDPVPADALRPGYCDRDQVIYLARNLRRGLLAQLPLPPVPNPQDMADLRIRTYPPTLEDCAGTFCRPWMELNNFEGDQAQYQGGGYGRSVAEWGGRSTLLLMLDFKPQEKERLLQNYVQYGVDLWGLVKNGYGGWPAHGGWGSGRKWAIVFAGVMLGEEKLANVNQSFPKVHFQEDMQTMHDDGWTGAGAVYYGHIGTRALTENTPTGWGPVEHLHPSRWPDSIGRNYRCDMTGSTWVAEALAIRMIQAEKQWHGDAFLDYCDRWMTEPDPGYGTEGAGFSFQGGTWDPFFKQMWKAYRDNLPAVEGKKVERPPTGWQKDRPLKGPAVEIGKNRELRVGGKPLFPIMIFASDPGRIDDAAAIAANVVAEGCFEPQVSANFAANHSNKDFLDKLAAKGMYGVFGADARTIGHPALLGWIHLDAPDKALSLPLAAPAGETREQARARMKQILAAFPSWDTVAWAINRDPLQKGRPEAMVLVEPVFRWFRQMDKGRPVFLTLGPDFFKIAEDKKELAADYLKCCDVVGCRVPAAQVGDAVRKLRDLAGNKPIYAWIETKGVKPEEVRAAVQTAIKQGATGIGYRGFEGTKGEKPDDAVLAELKKINEQIAGHAAELLADPAKAETLLN